MAAACPKGWKGCWGTNLPIFPISEPTHGDGLWCATGVRAGSSTSSPPPAMVHPRQPQKSPRLISGETLEAALLSPREPSIACIPASLRNPICRKNKPLITILFYSATVMKPQKLRKEDKKRERRHCKCPPAPSALILQPSVLSGFCLSHAAKVTPDLSVPPERLQDVAWMRLRGWFPPATSSPAPIFRRAAPSSSQAPAYSSGRCYHTWTSTRDFEAFLTLPAALWFHWG